MELLLVSVVLQSRMPMNPSPGDTAGFFFGMMCWLIFFMLFSIPCFAGLWGVFIKAGQPGWAAIVPYYNFYVLLQITDKPVMWLVFYIICPCVGMVFSILVFIELANRFGQSGGFAAGLILLPIVFLPILGFGSARYMGGRRRRPRRYDDDEDEDEDDRPRRPRRRSEEEDEDEDDRPRRPRRRSDEDDEDEDEPPRRPRRRSVEDDEDEDEPPRRPRRPRNDD